MAAQAQYALLCGEAPLQLLQELAAGGVVPPELTRVPRREDQAQAGIGNNIRTGLGIR